MKILEFFKYAKKYDVKFYKKFIIIVMTLSFVFILNIVMDYCRVHQVFNNVNQINLADELVKNAAELEGNKNKIAQSLSTKHIAKTSEIDNIQKDIIEMSVQFDVNVQRISFKNVPDIGDVYEISILGEWSNTMKYIYWLTNNSTLIKIIDINMEADNSNKIICTAHYKIYKED